jgi:hypothetical protein
MSGLEGSVEMLKKSKKSKKLKKDVNVMVVQVRRDLGVGVEVSWAVLWPGYGTWR